MSDVFTEERSAGESIGSSFKSALFGLVLFLGSFALLWWNEGRSVRRFKDLSEGKGMVVSIAADKVGPANNGKLVHASAMATTTETLTDPQFGLGGVAIKLHRKVQMYQWDEDEETTDKKKTYTYEKKWSESVIDSGKFKQSADHQNPASMAVQKNDLVAQNVTFGAFALPAFFVDQMNQGEPLAPTQEAVAKLPPAVVAKGKLNGNEIYVGADAANPQVGDLRISFEVVKPAQISVVAAQVENTFEPYHTKATGQELELFDYGTLSAEAMFKSAEEENVLMTWFLRLAGFVCMALGFGMLFSPLLTLTNWIPLVGGFLNSVMGVGVFVVSLFVAFFFSSFTIAVAWLRFRPMLAIPLLVAGVGALALVFFMGRAKQGAQTA